MSDTQSNAGEVIASIDASESQEAAQPNLTATDQEESSEEIEAEAEGSEESNEAPKDDKKKIEALKKKLKLKVDGEEFEEEIDLNDEEGLKKHLQLSKAAQKRMQEFSELRKQVDEFVKALKSDPKNVLKQMGHNFDELAEKHIESMIENAKKSPEQIEKEKMESELKSLKEEKERLAKEKEQSELERLRDQEAAQIETDINKFLEQNKSILPKSNPWVLRNVAQYMLLAMQNGYENVSVKDVIPVVEKQFKSDLQEMFAVMPEAVMESVIGKGNLDRLRKMRLKQGKAKTETANQIAKPTGVQVQREDKPREKRSYKSLFSPIED